MTAILKVDQLRAYYVLNHFGLQREVRAVDNVSLEIRRNEIYGIAGESSCGKSTLIKTIAAAIRPPLKVISGSIHYSFAEDELYRLSPAALSRIRWRHLSYITQGSMNVLNPVRRVRETFVDFAFPHMRLSRADFFKAVEAHCERLHLPVSVLGAFPHELSGGMRQRVTIALATICRPELVIADEPTTALDVVVQKEVLAMVREAQQQIGSSMIFVTHDLTVHAAVTDRLGVMYAGRLVEEGPTREIIDRPLHPYTASLLASLPRLGDRTAKKGLSGAPPNLSAPPAGCRFHPRCPLAMDICRQSNPALTELAAGHRVACYAASPAVRPSEPLPAQMPAAAGVRGAAA